MTINREDATPMTDRGALEARVDAIATRLDDFRDETRRGREELKGLITGVGDRVGHRLDDHARRIRSVELWRYLLTGGIIVLAFLFGTPALLRLVSVAAKTATGP